MFKFGTPRLGELSTWIGAGGLTLLLGLLIQDPAQVQSIEGLAIAVISVLSAFNKEEDADRKTSVL